MTNEELKKKIVDALCGNIEYELRNYPIDNYSEIVFDYEKTADALIAAGIGDVSELRNHRVVAEYSLIPEDGNSYVLPNTPLRVKQLYSGEEVEKIVKERDEYKHRAEVAERAIKIADKLGELCGRKEDYVQQAEKELAEARK